MTKSRVAHVRISITKQYQMMVSSVTRVEFVKTKVIFKYHIKVVSNQVSSNSDHEIKSCSCSNSSTKMRKKWKSGKKFSGLQNGAIRGLQIGAGFRDYKSEQKGLQTGVALGISNWDKKITNRGRDFKSGEIDFKSGQGLHIGAEKIIFCNYAQNQPNY